MSFIRRYEHFHLLLISVPILTLLVRLMLQNILVGASTMSIFGTFNQFAIETVNIGLSRKYTLFIPQANQNSTYFCEHLEFSSIVEN